MKRNAGNVFHLSVDRVPLKAVRLILFESFFFLAILHCITNFGLGQPDPVSLNRAVLRLQVVLLSFRWGDVLGQENGVHLRGIDITIDW